MKFKPLKIQLIKKLIKLFDNPILISNVANSSMQIHIVHVLTDIPVCFENNSWFDLVTNLLCFYLSGSKVVNKINWILVIQFTDYGKFYEKSLKV